MTRTVIVAATVPVSVRKLLAPQIAELAARGYRVEVVTSPGDDDLSSLSGVARVHLLPMTREMSPSADLAALVAWLKLLRQVRPHAVITFSPKASLLGIGAAWLMRVPERVYSSGGLRLETAHGWARRVMWLSESLTCALATRVVTNSPSLAKVYTSLRLGRGKIAWTTSRKGVDHHFFDPSVVTARVPVAGPQELPVLGFVGRVTADKGVPLLHDALAILRREGVGLRVLLVGPWETSDSSALIEALGQATPYLTAPGSISDVRPHYAAMDIFTLPSEREGFPNVVLEAGAMALPSIVTDATGCIDSVDDTSGITVPAGDPRALAAAIRRLIDDPELRRQMGKAARQRVVTDFDPAHVITHQLDLMGMGVQPCAASQAT